MKRKAIIVADPGIDGAFAIAVALMDPNLEVIGLAATAGNVGADQATRNLLILLEEFDPPRWPRIGAAPAVDYGINGSRLHGPEGLGPVSVPNVRLHQTYASDRLLIDLVREQPGEVAVIVLGPTTVLARAFDRDPELPGLIQRVICVGGTWHEPGNASAVAEFHFYCDPHSARRLLQSRIPITLLPLDVTRKALFSPGELMEMTVHDSRCCRFLKQIAPFGIHMTSNLYGIEGFHLKDVLGVAALAAPGIFETKSLRVDVEVAGELTRGMTVVDARPNAKNDSNVDLAVNLDHARLREYIKSTLCPSA
jgi:inosine-uridine nucleoside N-ribohydrolase